MAFNSEPQREQHELVSIVGMGCRWPGGSHTSEQFWNFFCNKVDGWKEFDDHASPPKASTTQTPTVQEALP
ncbi:hypothetical protein QC761_610330 [Podospora bellae-mahoneyi]|uniref:Beta-ketoacyl synthase-like N-terminal domain-containing protein n=1 Tax=Podospora bellae-mahoneyi TaxID=2093777 RepID=A0ABR0FB48_9PEZI|nr:hypothetical protein QC761_610330 [Podospora bellae-mahoneyi]